MSNTLTTWPRRYNFQEWRRLPQNQSLTEYEAQELFRREALKYTLYEQELMQLHSQQQATINNSINSLQSAVFNVFNVNAIINTIGNGRGVYITPNSFNEAFYSEQRELITDELDPDTGQPFILVTENLEILIAE